MSGAKLREVQVNGIYCHSLRNLSFASMLTQYRKLLLSAYGPKGGAILISNAVGRDTLAASSTEITKELSFRHPCAKYINALISAQNASCGLGGLYTGILTARLLEETLNCEDSTPHYVIAEVAEVIISQLLTQMAQFPDQVVTELDIGDMQQVSSFVKTMLGSKSSLNLSKAEMDNLSLQIVRAFLKSIPQENAFMSFGHVNISQEGAAGSDAKVYDGLLYREPDFDPKLLQKILLLPKNVNVLLFAIPLAPEGVLNAKIVWGGPNTKEEAFINTIVRSLLTFLKKKDVHVLANQKVIHPVIKFELERNGYIVLERLGTMATDALMKLSGCQAITDFSRLTEEIDSPVIGKLSSLQHISLKGRNYILMKQESCSLSTLLLPGVSPSIESTLKEITESCLAALKMVVVDGKVVAGGGCLETWLATQVNHLVDVNLDYLSSLMDVSNHHIIKIGSAFVRAFMELAIQLGGGSATTKFDWSVDSVFHHLWYSPPDMMNSEPNRESNASPSHETVQKCVCGLLSYEFIKHKFDGRWHELDFSININVKESFISHCACETLREIDKTSGELSISNSKLLSELSNAEDAEFGIDADSLDEKVAVEEDVDSLEKTVNSAEEEGDSLEGILESLDDDVDSLDDILDKMMEPAEPKCNYLKMTFDSRIPNVLFDSYLAKYNALRLALEGFTQLHQVGQCVYD